MLWFNQNVLLSIVKFLFCICLSLNSSVFFAQTHEPQKFLQEVTGTKNEGEQIVKHYCANCHAQKPLIQIGAPAIGNQDEWKVRLKKGYELIVKHTHEGFNLMPPRGGCFECSDEQLNLAIIQMLPLELQKDLIKTLSALKKNT